MNKKELNQILKNHKNWLNNNGGKPANLRYADLRNSNLSYVDLRGADLRSAQLRGADLLTFQFQQHQAYCTGERLTIGCEDHSLAVWARQYEQIGKKNGYSKQQIQTYKAFIDLCINIFKENNNE